MYSYVFQVDLAIQHRITAVFTHGIYVGGVNDNYIETFELEFSDDGLAWTSVQNVDDSLTFIANTDGVNIKQNDFNVGSFEARFVRLTVTGWPNGSDAATNWGLQGCQVNLTETFTNCSSSTAVGTTSCDILESVSGDSFSSSSNNPASAAAENSRWSDSGWRMGRNERDPWLQVYLFYL